MMFLHTLRLAGDLSFYYAFAGFFAASFGGTPMPLVLVWPALCFGLASCFEGSRPLRTTLAALSAAALLFLPTGAEKLCYFPAAVYPVLLAYTGAVKDDILDTETLAFHLMQMLWERYPDAVRARYKIDLPADADGVQLLEAAGRKRGFLISGGEIDLERMAKVLLEEYRSCKLGRFTLEAPEQLAQEETE